MRHFKEARTFGKRSFFLSVIIPPTFVETPGSLEVTEGKHFKLVCKAHGKPVPIITWYREDDLITGDVDMKIQSKDNSRKFEMESTLQTTKTSLADESPRYVVKAENKAGSVLHEFSLTGNIILLS